MPLHPYTPFPARLAAWALAATSLLAQAQAQTAAPTRTPAIAGVVAADTPIELIREGFNGTEGPLGLPDGSLIFTETNAQRITRIAADGSTSAFLEYSNGANGLGFAPNGDLVAVQVAKPQVGIVFPYGSTRVLAERWEGKPFGRPNDLVVDRQGNVYFTDSGVNVPAPAAGASAPADAAARREAALAAAAAAAPPAVYRIARNGTLQRLAADIERPNGIQLSPDERVLFVANSNGEHLLAYDIQPDGTLGPRRNFARLAGGRKLDSGGTASGADGLAVDAQGRVFVATPAGVQVFDAQGAALGVIALPKAPQNLAFAGEGKRTLYVVGRGAAWRIATLTAGHAGRAK